jgi:hypothetical protein
MREPPDQKRKTPPQHHPRQGQIRKVLPENDTDGVGRRTQAPAHLPGLGPKSSLHAAPAAALADPWLPVRDRIFAFGVSHRLAVGASVKPGDERELRRIHFQRRRQLAAFSRVYR